MSMKENIAYHRSKHSGAGTQDPQESEFAVPTSDDTMYARVE